MEHDASTRIMVCYDQSPHARAAITEAARLFPKACADIVTVYERGWPIIGLNGVFDQRIDADLRERAKQVCDEGVGLARAAGLDARPIFVAAAGPVWHAIVELSGVEDYGAIVVGARGRSPLLTSLLGGVSAGVTAHAPCPVLVVHEPARHTETSGSLDDSEFAEGLHALSGKK